MKLSGYMDKSLIVPRMMSIDKKHALDKLLERIEEIYDLADRPKVLADLLTREKQSTTGIGCGIAIPHTIVPTLERTLLVLAGIPDGLDFDAVDGHPVHALFLLLSPPGRVGEHIRLLARIARVCADGSLVRGIANAPTADEIVELIGREDERHVG